MIRFLLFLMAPFFLKALPVNNLDAEVQWDSIWENTPYTVTLSVTHDANDKIDSASFTANNKKINPVFLKSVKISDGSPLEISIYTVEMPGLPAGLQSLPTFSVKLKDLMISSIPTGFEVKSGAKQSSSSNGEVLKLEPIFTGTEPLYPGQRFFLGYRYYYNRSVDLSDEKLPLLEAQGFRKIGDKQIESGTDKGMSVTQVLQQVEALEPGSYTFDPSTITGHAYTADAKGQKVYNKTPLHSALPSFLIKVAAFPDAGKPASFQGAIGHFTIKANIVGPDIVNVGDKVRLLISITGEQKDLEQLKPPELCCQPGFSGNFVVSDLPPETSIQGNTKSFLFELYVKNSEVKALPSIEFSSFNPGMKIYERKSTQSIPIKVNPEAFTPVKKQPVKVDSPESASLAPLEALEHWTMLSIPLGFLAAGGIGLLVFQSHFLEEKKELKPKQISRELFQKAILEKGDSFYPLAIQALRQRAVEKNMVERLDAPLDGFPDSLEKSLLVKWEEIRFSQKNKEDIHDAVQDLIHIFHS